MKRIFDGIRVVEFTTAVAGPVATAMLADQGAEVLKIEKTTGDEMRLADPFYDGESVSFMWANRGKKSLAVPLNTPEGLAIIKELVKTADVILENFRPGVMKKYGLDYEGVRSIQPSIIYCSISAFGQTGPYYKEAGYDFIAQAMSGIMDMTGEPDQAPVAVGTILGDYNAACNAFGAISAALYHRERTGEGNYIDLSLVEALVGINHNIEAAGSGLIHHRSGRHAPGAAPFGLFNGNNGQCIIICAHTPKLYNILCQVIGHPELVNDPQFATRLDRYENLQALTDYIEGFLKSFASIEEPMALIKGAGVPTCKVIGLREVLTDPHFLERGVIADIPTASDVTSADSFKGRGIYLNFSNTPGKIGVPPALGEHNAEVFRTLGKTEAEIEALNAQWRNGPRIKG